MKIESEEQLLETIQHIHFTCFELCKKALGKHLPVAGNVGVFCHHQDEFEFLTKIRENLTDEKDNWNKKYYRLHAPIIIPKNGEAPEATYTHLYIRKPDNERSEAGDIDFVLKGEEFKKVINLAVSGQKINEVEISYRSDLNMVWLSSSGSDALPFITDTYMSEKNL